MANDISGNPIIVDTLSATPITLSTIKIKTIYWFRPLNTADTFTIKNAAGRTFIEGQCEVANQSQWFYISGMNGTRIEGLTVTVLGSGKLYIFTE